jgi:uncharacterized protein
MALHNGYADLEDKAGIDALRLQFDGFDGNNEGPYLGYAKYLINRLGYFRESKDAGDGLNSHFPTLDRYRLILKRWKATPNPRKLTREDILSIIPGARATSAQ